MPDAPYELNVGSEVLGTFFSSADEKGENKRSRHESENPYDALRNLSSKDLQRISKGAKGLGGKLPPPPDPAVFEELKEIVEARLKASLARLVVATYNNVGMSRAYCGSAGGIVIGIITRCAVSQMYRNYVLICAVVDRLSLLAFPSKRRAGFGSLPCRGCGSA